jgi:hypothetical protein
MLCSAVISLVSAATPSEVTMTIRDLVRDRGARLFCYANGQEVEFGNAIGGRDGVFHTSSRPSSNSSSAFRGLEAHDGICMSPSGHANFG